MEYFAKIIKNQTDSLISRRVAQKYKKWGWKESYV